MSFVISKINWQELDCIKSPVLALCYWLFVRVEGNRSNTLKGVAKKWSVLHFVCLLCYTIIYLKKYIIICLYCLGIWALQRIQNEKKMTTLIRLEPVPAGSP